MASQKNGLIEQLKIKQNLLKHIYDISALLLGSPDLKRVLNEIIDRSMVGLNYDRSIIMLLDSDEKNLQCVCIKGFTADGERRAWEKPLTMGKHDCYETKVVRLGTPMFVVDTDKASDATPLDLIINKYQQRSSVLYVPLKVRNKVIGFLGVDRFRTRMEITHVDVDSLAIFANQASIVIENTRLHEALTNEKTISTNIIKFSTNGVIVSDLIGNVLNLNPRAEEILDICKKDALQMRIQDIFKFTANERLNIVRKLKKQEDMQFYEYNYIRPDQTKVIVNLSAFALRDENLKVIGAVTLLTDLTEKKQMDNYIARVEKFAAIGRITTNIAHEVRNPLSAIYTTVQNLISELSEQTPAKEDLTNILGEIGRVETLMREVLSLVRPVPLQFEILDIRDLLKSTLLLLREEMAKRNISCIQDCDMDGCLIKADPNRLKQVFLNLVINAAEATDRGGNILIKVNSTKLNLRGGQKRWTVIEIIDDGTGIREENINKIFDPFYTTKGGTGLGLTTSHRIIEEHGGIITVESEEGQGSKFQVLLPSSPPL